MSQPPPPAAAGQPVPPGSDPFWQLVFEATSDGVLLGDASGRIIAANARAAELLGLAASALVGRATTDFLLPLAGPTWPPPASHPAREIRLRRADGTEVPVAVAERTLDDRRRVVFLRDRRARQPHEARLSRITATLLNLGDDLDRNVQRFTALCGELLEADCALYHRLDGHLLRARGQWHLPAGFKGEDTPDGHLCFDVIRQSSSEPRVISQLQDTPYFTTDPNVAAFGLRTYLGCPVKFGGVHRGSLCVVYTQDHQPSADDLQIIGLLAAAIGQEEDRTQALTALQIKDRAIEASLSAIALADREGRLTYVNPAFLALWGYADPGEVLGRSAPEFWEHPGHAAQVIAALANRGSWVGELTGKRRDGATFSVQLFATQVKNAAGQPVGMVASFTDITGHRQTEGALRDNEERLRLALTGTNQGLFDLDLRTGAATCTPEYATMLGYDPAEFRLDVDTWTELLHPEDRARALAALGSCIAGEIPAYSKEYRLRTRAGGWEWVLSSGKVVAHDAAGRALRLIGTHLNITARKQAEQALRDTEFFLNKSQEVTHIGSYSFDATTGAWIGSPSLDQIFGLDRDEPKTVEVWTNLVVPEQRDEMRQYFEQHVLIGHNRFDREYRICRKSDQQVRWVFGQGEVDYEADGRPLRMIGTIQDITERKQAEMVLDETRRLYEELVAHAPMGVYRIEAQNETSIRFVYVSDRYCETTGVSRAAALANAASAVVNIHPEDRAGFDVLNRAALRQRQPFCWEGRCLVRGQTRWLHAESRPSSLADGCSIWTGIVYDITERKQAEQARLELERRLLHAQKLESLGVLAGGIAHDFNNLLTAILGNLDLALMDLSPVSPARSCIEQSATAARRAADLTRQMLAYSGRGSFIIRQLDLNALVQENAHLFRACISKLVTLSVETTANLPRIKADPSQIQQVVMNLITNASESIGDRPGAVRLRTGVLTCDEATLRRSRADEIPPAGQFVVLEVTDTGCGMDESTQQRLFDPFFTTKFTGRGLGMSAILGIVRGHRGAIFVDSTVGQGATIRVLFPALANTAATLVEPQSPASRPPTATPAGLILVVDDEEVVRRVCSQMLTRRGWRVLEAADGLQAIATFRRHSAEIVCVVLDLSMPHIGGIEVFRTLRRIRPDARVILSSGYGNDQSTGKKLTTEGLAGFIQKPYSTDALLSELERALKQP